MKQLFNETAKQRVKQFLQAEGIKQSFFERKVGLKFGDFSGSLNSETLRRILELYPQINVRWLVFGEGDMYAQDTTASTLSITEEPIA